jgi:hypothetical protein
LGESEGVFLGDGKIFIAEARRRGDAEKNLFTAETRRRGEEREKTEKTEKEYCDFSRVRESLEGHSSC